MFPVDLVELSMWSPANLAPLHSTVHIWMGLSTEEDKNHQLYINSQTTLPSLLMTSLCSSAHMVTFKEGQNKDTVIAQQRRMCVNRRVANYQAHVLQLTQMKALFSVEQIASFPTHLKASSSPSATYSKNYTHEHAHIRINCPFNYHNAPTHPHTQLQSRSCMLLTASGQKVLLKTDSQPRRHAEGVY